MTFTTAPRYPDVDYSSLPEHMQEAARDYIEHGYKPGDFLYAALSNDLVEAFAHADMDNVVVMKAWVQWLYNEAPSSCWGTREKVMAWIDTAAMTRDEASAS